MQENSSIEKFNQQTEQEQTSYMQQYYKLQSKIYDATRWSFLFGRNRIIREIPLDTTAEVRILEIGCGTGYNLRLLGRRFPKAQLIGMDVSQDMIDIATKKTTHLKDRIQLIAKPYMPDQQDIPEAVDAVLFSYSLTMINPQWKDLILQAKKDLKPGGYIAVTDFHDSKNTWFKKHMSNHHVRMDSHLTPLLEQEFEPVLNKVKLAYGGVWQYLLFVGRKE